MGAAVTDLSSPNLKPGKCSKCSGTGRYVWGAIVNGKATHSGECKSCLGKGTQTWSDIGRNRAYNRHKISRLAH
jgi:DnaJ-class molecular chaperone